MIDVRTAAKYLIQRYEQESGSSMDEMKLHKLLYFTQRESFVLLGKPMFLDKFEAWKYGPVMRCIRKAHWEYHAQSVLPVDSEYIPVLEDTLQKICTDGFLDIKQHFSRRDLLAKSQR